MAAAVASPMAAASGAGADDSAPQFFTVVVTGQIESGDIPRCENAYCKYSLVHGEDWAVLDGLESGTSQSTRKGHGPGARLVWNFPLEVTYRSYNAFGWPQVVLTVTEVDAFGRDVVVGYGRCHVPIAAGRYVRPVRLFRPVSASLLQQFINWLMGTPAEYVDPHFPAQGEGREVTRVVSTGVVDVQFNVMTKDMALFGYTEEPGSELDRRAAGCRVL